MSVSREFAIAGVAGSDCDPLGMYINVGQDTRSVRSARYGGQRLLIATGAPFSPGEIAAHDRLNDLRRWFVDRFPVDEVSYIWAAQDTHTGDQILPFIYPLHPLPRTPGLLPGSVAGG